jgi:signal transduction histidine kinase/ActR/RegA family two-component response regulator
MISAGTILYSVTRVNSLSILLQGLYDGPLMSISHARSAQERFTKTAYAVERAISLHEQLSANELNVIENSMKEFETDMNVVRERMGENASELIDSTLVRSESWFKAAMAYIKPSTQGVTQLTSPLVLADQGREITSSLENIVEAAAAYGFNFRYEAENSASALFRNLLVAAVVILIFGMAFAILTSYSAESEKMRSEQSRALAELEVKRQRDLTEQQQYFIASLREKSESLERSIAERAEMEKRLVQSQKLEAVGQLTGGIAHDFNNLLLVVIGNLDLLKDTTPAGSSELELIESSLTAALTGSELSNSLLAFSRQHAFKLETVDIRTVVADQVRLLKRAMGRKVTLEETSADNVFPITVDAAQLRCALTNLVVNARDAMQAGGAITVCTSNITLTKTDITVADGLEPGDYAVLEIADTGVGISPEDLQRIFDPFFTTKDVGKGTGLGLSMVYGFVKEMKGKIKVTSKVGKGTTFSVFFPRSAELQEVASPALVPADTPAPAEERKTVLVVDDDDMVRKSVIAQLRSLGYATIEANNPDMALEVIEGDESIDLLFSDIVMPGSIDGIELARRSSERRPTLKILLTSGYPDLKASRAEQAYTQWEVLKKPYRRSDLREALREILTGAAPQLAQLSLH